MWWTRGVHLPALVTTSPQGTPVDQAGVLPDATVLYGDRAVLSNIRSGFRTSFGTWLNSCRTWGAEIDYFTLGDGTADFSQTSEGDPILARPFYNVQEAEEGSVRVAYPGLVAGTISVHSHDSFQSIGALMSYELLSACETGGKSLWQPSRLELLGGFRYYNLNDSLGISEVLHVTQPGLTQNTAFQINDTFRTNNDFYGAELGLRTRYERGPWSLGILIKMALGNTHQSINIGGQTVITAINQPTQTHNSGILALDSNRGSYHRNSFTAIPQLGFDLGYQLTGRCRAYVGYDLLYWARVSRAADQVDLDVDPRNFPPALPGAAHFPEFLGRTGAFWAQGINVGTEFRF